MYQQTIYTVFLHQETAIHMLQSDWKDTSQKNISPSAVLVPNPPQPFLHFSDNNSINFQKILSTVEAKYKARAEMWFMALSHL